MQSHVEDINRRTQSVLGKVQTLLGSGTLHQLKQMVNGLRPVEIAQLIESSPPPARTVIWDLIATPL